jgi:hypothetical protein
VFPVRYELYMYILLERNSVLEGLRSFHRGSRNMYVPSYQFCMREIHGLVVRVPGYRTEMYCDSCEVRDEFIYVM